VCSELFVSDFVDGSGAERDRWLNIKFPLFGHASMRNNHFGLFATMV
jgi:hypothetical protein